MRLAETQNARIALGIRLRPPVIPAALIRPFFTSALLHSVSKKSMLKNWLPLLFILALAPGASLAEESIKIAVVDMQKVFASHPSTATATKELSAARETSRADFKEKSNTLKKILQKHQELIRAGKKKDAGEELIKANEAEKAIATLRSTGLRDLEESFRKAKLEIMKDIQKSVAAFNKDAQFAIVLDQSSASSNGLPQVVHAPGATDITNDVISFIKKSAEAKPK